MAFPFSWRAIAARLANLWKVETDFMRQFGRVFGVICRRYSTERLREADSKYNPAVSIPLQELRDPLSHPQLQAMTMTELGDLPMDARRIRAE